jgi:hypothetical protein
VNLMVNPSCHWNPGNIPCRGSTEVRQEESHPGSERSFISCSPFPPRLWRGGASWGQGLRNIKDVMLRYFQENMLVSCPRSSLYISASYRRRWQGGPTTEYREYSEEAQRRQCRREPTRYATSFWDRTLAWWFHERLVWHNGGLHRRELWCQELSVSSRSG